MEKKKRHEKGKIASLSERIDDEKRKGKEEIAWSSSSEKGRDDQIATWIGDASWKRGSKRRRGEVIEIEMLNEDLLEQVMLRLPVKSLIRFQIVSKEWMRMIKSRSFKDKYLLRQKTQEPKFLCVDKDRSWFKRSLAIKKMRLEGSWYWRLEEEEEEEEHVEIVSESVDGIFCLYGYTDLRRQIRVINPATRWSYRLPFAGIQLRKYYDNYKSDQFALPGFGKDYVTGTYKLVWLHNLNCNKTLSCEVFDFQVKKWREVIPPPHYYGYRIKRNLLPTFANGWLYWFSKDNKELVAFDLHMEMFQVLPNPISSSVDMQMGSTVDDLVWISETNGHVWRLTNHNTGGELLKMDKMLSIDMNKITSIPLEPNLLLFQLLNPTYRIFPPPRPSHTSSLVPYFPSLVSPL